MAGTTESSVMLALSELSRLEADRVAEEAALRQKEEDRLRREREERAQAEQHRLRVAEAEARLRVVEELRAAEAAQRATRLEHELRIVKAERVLLSENLATLSQTPEPRSRHLVFAFTAGVLLLLGGLTAIAFTATSPPPPPVTPIASAKPAAAPALDADYYRRVSDLEKRLAALQADRLAKEAQAVTHPTPRPLQHHPAPGNKPATSAQIDYDKCSDDPIGCVKVR